MKKTNLFSFALAAMLLGACSNDDVVTKQNGPVAAGEDGYISLSINLPSQNSTRANDNFDYGTAAEYAVNDATLLLFSGSDEASATFSGAYELAGTWSDAQNQNITRFSTTTARQITKPGGDKIYALVVLNKNNVLTSTNDAWSLAGISLTKDVTTFNDLRTTASTNLNSSDFHGNGFFMTNAPLFSKAGGATSPADGVATTLTEIDPAKIWPTEAEATAEGATAGDIYVERAVAKVTVTATTGLDETVDGKPVEIVGWAFDNTNNSTYPVRNVVNGNSWNWDWKANGSADYRFVGSAPVATGLYRTYWALDPNYDTTPDGAFTSTVGQVPSTLLPLDDLGYCFENTFNLDNKEQATRVIIAAKLNEGNSFYIWNGNKSVMYSETDMAEKVKELFMNTDEFKAQVNSNSLDQGKTFNSSNLTVEFQDPGTTSTGDLRGSEDRDVVKITTNATGDMFKSGSLPDVLTADGIAAVIKKINDKNTFAYYGGGIAYYPVDVRHFDDSQVAANGTTPEDALGTYGVLRNNWYEISVQNIITVGGATVPEITGDAPWISVKINVLSWAKRSQNVEL